MSREIRFRAFIEIEGLKLMIDDAVVYPGGNLGCDSGSFDEALPDGWSYDGDNNLIKGPDGKEIELDDIDVFNHEGEWVFFEGVPMQFTGLKDKSGNEIYSGDILKVCNGSINGSLWMDPNRVVNDNANGWSLPAYCWNPDFSSNMDSTHWCEVIGNIYQNPDLL